ncbi:hypothetical protein acsn021_20840 [Anaerocolumna cellulosilytica]|uniref:Nucleoside phosphorylase domain-containing protein n=1 Tax=Anaerocolumna cellulosilytica TaxID=433286 RepID=A0A6S6R522_9FIRM|nr:hypothetical protein [Anaerocolumna cellulosilytica]MBB5194272.1 uridine phosphorylase [Anaerocolumna cellulosilytica]BCJ94515.1 hypothetical protein acsn021_20840 [Anaerocolumna cellulosilytica]
MLILCMALYNEALPLINYLKLKKDTDFTKFQLFRNEKVLLLITGAGKISSAIALTSLCNCFPPSGEDLLVNIGVCGCTDQTVPEGTVFLCNKILEAETGRTFFPDMVYSHPFLEDRVLTSPVPIDLSKYKETKNYSEDTETKLESAFLFYIKQFIKTGDYLVDMEAASLYQTATYFFQTHQMIFLKVVSDYLMVKGSSLPIVTPQRITALLEKNCSQILEWIMQIEDNNAALQVPTLTIQEKEALKELSTALHLSVTMEHSLWQYSWYYKVREGCILTVITDFLAEMPNRCKTKAEGKKYFDKFKQRLL